MKYRIYSIIFAVLLCGFTTYVVLDTFFIVRTYQKVDVYEGETDTDVSETNSDSQAADEELTATDSENSDEASDTGNDEDTNDNDDMGYDKGTDSSSDSSDEDDATVSSDTACTTAINIYEEEYCNTTIHVAEITLSDITDLRAAFAENSYGRNIKATVSDIAESVNAIFAVNGDFYGARESGYVIRNGVLYRSDSAGSSQEDLVIYADGTAEIIKEGNVSAEDLVNKGAWQVFSFGPGLVEGGEIIATVSSEVEAHMASNPRTAIAMIDAHHYLLVVSDGRTSDNEGLSLYELAEYLQGKGALVAYNLDGGGSSTMYYDGDIINYPTTDGDYHERRVSDILYLLATEE